MPELPEVETVKNQLAPYIIGRTITKVTLLWDRMVKRQDPVELVKRVAGQKILDVMRHGKYLIMPLSSGDNLIIHLKMTGSLIRGRTNPNRRNIPAPLFTWMTGKIFISATRVSSGC